MPKSNIDPLINEYCKLKIEIDEKTKRLSELRKELLPFCDVTEPLKTKKWCIVFTESDVTILDTEKIKSTHTVKWLKKFEKKTKRQTFRVVKIG